MARYISIPTIWSVIGKWAIQGSPAKWVGNESSSISSQVAMPHFCSFPPCLLLEPSQFLCFPGMWNHSYCKPYCLLRSKFKLCSGEGEYALVIVSNVFRDLSSCLPLNSPIHLLAFASKLIACSVISCHWSFPKWRKDSRGWGSALPVHPN